MKLLISRPVRPFTFVIGVCIACQILLMCTSCVYYDKDRFASMGGDFEKVDHQFGTSITIEKAETSTAFAKAADKAGSLGAGLITAGVAKAYLGNERAATDGANALAGKEVDAGVTKSAQQVDLEKTKLFLEAEAVE